MKNAYINNTQIHDYQSNIGMYIQPPILGLEMPNLRLSSYERPNVDGAFVPSQLYGGRVVSFTGFVGGGSIAAYRANRRTITSLFKIRRSDEVLLANTFKFKTMDDLELQIDCYTNLFSFPDHNLSNGKYQVHLFAPKHEIYSQAVNSETIYIHSGGGMAIPTALPMDMSVDGSIEATLVNAGNIEAYPTVTFYGPLTNPTLTNETNGDVMNLTYTLTSGQRIVVDTKNHTALYYSSDVDTTGDNVLDDISGDFLRLASGSNTIKLTDSVYNASGRVQLSWRDTYSGV